MKNLSLSFLASLVWTSVATAQLAVVSILATVPETTEPSPNLQVRPGEFLITRGDVATALGELQVYIEYGGTATPGVDYAELPHLITIPAGALGVTLLVEPRDDDLVEGDETVIAKIVLGPPGPAGGYAIAPLHNQARVTIHDGVGDPPPSGVVRIEATRRIAEETSFPFRRLRLNGLFTISRTGSTGQAQPVWVHYSGSSTPDKDYPALPLLVSIPAGAAAVEIPVEANVDETPEAIETLVATLSNCPPPPIKAPCYEFDIDRAHSEAIVFLRDDGITEASLDLLRPEQGARFELAQTIYLEALAVDLESYISHVEFWDGEEQIGVSDIYFIRAPDPGTPILHGFEWTKAAPGPHVLTARTTTPAGVTILSLPVKIEVGPGPTPPVVGIRSLVPETREPLCDPAICDGPLPAPGVFLLSRRGGDLSQALSVMIQYAGGAINGTDYESLPGVATFQSGQASVEILVSAKFDQLVEGDEKVVAEPQPDPSLGPIERYRVDPTQATAVVIIHDNDPVTTRLQITAPREGQQFQPGDLIELRAQVFGPGSGESWSVDFFDGDRPLGTTKPGGTIWWSGAGGGPHVINALAHNPAGIPGQDILSAVPVNITVGPGPAWPVVSLTASNWKTSEPCPVCRIAPGVLMLSRTGTTTKPLTVYLEADGTAEPGTDYQPLPRVVTIPAGSESMQLFVVALDDQLAEGPEVVRTRIVSPELATLGYLVSARQNEALVVIGDDEAGAPEARLDIIEPQAGTQFAVGTIIQISALGVSTRGEVSGPVEFYAGNKLIGRSSPDLSLRPPIPYLPSLHAIWWSNPPPGPHVLTARSQLALNQWVEAPPVTITVGPEQPRTVVRIEATQRIAEEDSLPFDRVPFQGVFTISRNGPITDSLPVYVRYSGSATSETDYPTLPWVVTIPAGAATREVRVVPFPDQLPEGIETLVATISNCPPPWLLPPCYDFGIDPAHESATVFIRDDGETQSSLVITQPKNNTQFNAGDVIHIEVIAIDLRSYISRVEFWDGEQRIGVSEVDFILPPDPGTPILHTFEWRGAPAGDHVLTARVPRTDGTTLRSQPVRLQVGPAITDRVVLDIVATDPLAREPDLRQPGDPAVFTVRRTAGPLNIAVSVHYGLEGTAVNGQDYETLPGTLLLRAGERSVDLVIRPLSDVMMEGEETVVAHLSAIPCFSPPPPECYLIGQSHSARAVILDASPQNQPPKAVLTRPTQNQVFEPGQAVSLRLEAVDPDGYAPRAEFFADGRRIGEQILEFIRRPEPGQTQVFEFVWENPLPGPHRLTARVTDDQGLTGSAPVVEILVGRTEPLPMVAVLPLDPFAREPGVNTLPDTATFGIVRFGPSTEPLEVSYSLGGTAENGVDYTRLTGRVTFEAGRETALVTVVPLADDHAEGIETLVLRLNESSQYQLAPLRHATAIITDRNFPSPAASPDA